VRRDKQHPLLEDSLDRVRVWQKGKRIPYIEKLLGNAYPGKSLAIPFEGKNFWFTPGDGRERSVRGFGGKESAVVGG